MTLSLKIVKGVYDGVSRGIDYRKDYQTNDDLIRKISCWD